MYWLVGGGFYPINYWGNSSGATQLFLRALSNGRSLHKLDVGAGAVEWGASKSELHSIMNGDRL